MKVNLIMINYLYFIFSSVFLFILFDLREKYIKEKKLERIEYMKRWKTKEIITPEFEFKNLIKEAEQIII